MGVPELMDLVKDDQVAHFEGCNGTNLYYKVQEVSFPIPLEDTKGGYFARDMKAVTLMRWIRKHLTHLRSAEAAKEAAG